MIGTLADLASLPGMPSEPTLRKLIDGDPGFAGIIKRATGKGDAFEIDLPIAARYVGELEERKREAERARREDLAQLGLALGLAAGAATPGVTIADRKALLEEEMIAMAVGRKRGELVEKASVEAAIGQLLVWHQQHASSFSARLAKRADVPRALQAAIDALVTADLIEFARRMRGLGEVEVPGDGEIGDPASAPVDAPAN